MTVAGPPGPFRVGFVPGVTPDKWARRWNERMGRRRLEVFPVEEAEQVDVLREQQAHMCLVRLPVDRDGLHLIPLYDEAPVVVANREHPVAAYHELALSDLADEIRHIDLPAQTAVETVAAGTGVVVLPISVARLHHRKDVVAVPLTDVPPTTIGLAWLMELEDDRVDTFIGIVRGRTARSSR